MIQLVSAAELQAFAAERTPQQDAGINSIRPSVVSWLADFSNRDKRDAVVDAASAVWMDAFREQDGDAAAAPALSTFRESIGESLTQTSEPESPAADSQVDRIATWLSVSAINSGFSAGYAAAGGVRVRWTTMHDSSVRETHRSADGQTRALGQPFDIGGFELKYPGDPVGPPSIYLNCRCILSPAGRRGGAVTAAIELADNPDEVIEDDIELEDEDFVDDIPDEIPVHGVATIEGRSTGDGRGFRNGALRFGSLPQPLGFEFESSHGGDNSRVAIVGRIDEFWVVPHQSGEYSEARWRGVIFPGKDYGASALEGILDGSYTGVSVIVDDVAFDLVEDRGDDRQPIQWLSEARIRRFDMVPTGAFQEGFISIGPDFPDELTEEDLAALKACGCMEAVDDEEMEDLCDPDAEVCETEAESVVAGAFAPGTKDGPGWLTHPRATARIRRYWVRGKGAAKIRWGAPGDFNRCRRQLAKYVQNPEWLAGLCANMHKEALGIWPGQEAGGRGHHALVATGGQPAPLFALVAAGAPAVAPGSWFENPKLAGPTPLHVDIDTGQVYGHLATWGVCHIGIPGVCTTAPHSSSNYSYFRTGVVRTEEGADIPVGHITLATGHAPIKASAQAAAAHYDNTGSVVADVAAGEDSYGIWVAGSLRSGVDLDQASVLKAAALSGDWRTIGGKLELVGALAVNIPGFPIPRAALAASAERQESLVAAGVVAPTAIVASNLDAEQVAAITRNAVAELRYQEKREARLAAVAPVREQVRAERIAAVRAATVEED